MILSRLSILNYKNIAEATIDFSPKFNCFIGANGAGKTNVLDAVWFLSFCHSAVSSPDSLVIRHDAPMFVLQGEYLAAVDDDSADAVHIYCGMQRGQKKHFKRGAKEYRRLSEHIGLIPIVMVSPADSSLVDGGSEARRKMLDTVIAQIHRPYMTSLTRYNQALQQRNALLKQADSGIDESLLDVLEMAMAREGEQIYAERRDAVEQLQPIFMKYYAEICSSHETVELQYVSHCQRGPLYDVINRDRHKDLAVGYSLHGVHRDDIEITLNGRPMRREGSQGQLKTFVVALKLAQYELLAANASQSLSAATPPILLLDDIFDKLDASRVEKIVEIVSSDRFGQVLVTDTNRDHLDSILRSSTTDYRLFHVVEGDISETVNKEYT